MSVAAASSADTWTAVEIPVLSSHAKTEMYQLLARHFIGVSWEQFTRDLAEKTEVIQIRRDGALLGFTTLYVRQTTFSGAPLTAVYSGDTIVDPAGWGSPTLARAWITTVNRWRAKLPRAKCYWMLLTSGYRTYRFLPVFWREYYPRCDHPLPEKLRELMDKLAEDKYGEHYDRQSGIVRFPQPQLLRGRLGEIPSERVRDPNIAFFLSRNPTHARGDELVCLTEIAESNLTAAGRRMVAPR